MIPGLQFGCRSPLLVRHERVASRARGCWRLLYASDLHLTARRRHLLAQIGTIGQQLRPDAVLLGGDLVDRRSGRAVLAELVARVAAAAPVFAVPGNHDAGHGLAAVRSAVVDAGGHWLPDGDRVLSTGDRAPLHLHARPAPCPSTQPAFRVLVGHHPQVVRGAAQYAYDVAFAGHLHGGQCVWFERGGRLYPGAWFSRWNGLRFVVDATTLLVSRGAADTLPVRFRCPREVVLCSLEGVA